MKAFETQILPVTAGGSAASAGAWVRSRSHPSRLQLATVAHFLFSAGGSVRSPVRVAGARAEVVAAVPLLQRLSFSADAALLALPEDFALASFLPAAGHLSKFCKGLAVGWTDAGGNVHLGRLAAMDWSGTLRYHFGARRLAGQWVVLLDDPQASGKRGQSGVPWMTCDGVVAGLQVGILPRQPGAVLLTPMQSISELFQVAVAG